MTGNVQNLKMVISVTAHEDFMEIDVNLVSYELMISYSEDVPVFSLVKSCHIWFNPVIYALLKVPITPIFFFAHLNCCVVLSKMAKKFLFLVKTGIFYEFSNCREIEV